MDGVVGEVGGPAVGGRHGGVERAVGEIEPRWAGVVEFGQGAVFEACRAGGVARHQTLIAARADLEVVPLFNGRGVDVTVLRASDRAGKLQRLHARPLGRVQPVHAPIEEPAAVRFTSRCGKGARSCERGASARRPRARRSSRCRAGWWSRRGRCRPARRRNCRPSS